MNIWVFIYRLAWTMLGVLLAVTLVAAFYPKVRQYREMQKQENRLQEEQQLELDMLQHLKTKQDRLANDPRYIEKIAREELGLAKPGETVFKFVDDSSTNGRPGRP